MAVIILELEALQGEDWISVDEEVEEDMKVKDTEAPGCACVIC